MRITTITQHRGALVAAAGAVTFGLLVLPGTATAGGGVSQSVDVVLGLPSVTTVGSLLPKEFCYDPDSAGPAPKECKPLPPFSGQGGKIVMDLDYVLSSGAQPTSLLTAAGYVCSGTRANELGLVLQPGPAVYQPGSTMTIVVSHNGQPVFNASYPASPGQTQYGPSFQTC